MGPKSFCTTKEVIDKMKTQPTEWKKIFANDIIDSIDRGLISKKQQQPKKKTKKKNKQKT